MVDEPAVNAFQRALLGLARAGQRDLAGIADLLGLETELAELVRDDLRTLKYLDEFGAITPAGSAALADGFLDPQRIVVTHVYQDPFTGALWPATVPAPVLLGAKWLAQSRAELDLGTAGASLPIRPLAVPAGDTMPDIPAADEIVEAVSRSNRASARGETDGGWDRRPPARVAARVSVMTAGQPLYLPVVVAVVDGDTRDGGTRSATWLAFSPFSRKASHLLRRLIAIRGDRYPPLRQVIENLAGRPTEALLADYDRIGIELRVQYGELLDRRFGSGLREHRELVELLTLLELNVALAGQPGERASELSVAVNAGWRVQELVLREIVGQYPPRPADVDTRPPVWQRLMEACERIGLRPTEYKAMSVLETPEQLRRAIRPSGSPKTPELLAAAVISADQGAPEHPVRRLAQERSSLLTDLTRASQIRNDGSHAALVRIDLDVVHLSRRLASETVAAFLGMPAPDDFPSAEPPEGLPHSI